MPSPREQPPSGPGRNGPGRGRRRQEAMPGGWVWVMLLVLAVLGVSVPSFVVGPLLIWLFALNLGWLPTGGIDGWKNYLLPAMTLALAPLALLARYTRSAMLEVTHTDYVRTARAKGLHERMVIGRHAVVGSMRYGVRWTEELLIKSLFVFHPELANAGLLYDGSEEKRSNYTLEGGDVHYLRPDLLVVGFSERTSPAALDRLCDVAFERGLATDVLVVVLPIAPTAIHLDMIFSHVDHELCVVYPPYFIGPERLAVLHRRKGQDGVREMPSFFAAAKELGLPLQPIFAGGTNRTRQDREQWSSACNFLALRPGTIISYRRNDATLCELEAAGFRLVPAVNFLAFDDWREAKHRTAITVEGSELARGGGGPRCMSLPLRRQSL